jgi:hypothetical protein
MRRILMLIVFVLSTAVSAHAQFVAPGGSVPVVANLPGLNNTDWRTDVSIVNLGMTDTSIVMLLQPEIVFGEPVFEPITTDAIVLPAGEQMTMRNIVETTFGLTDTKGALSVFSTDGNPLVISARIYTLDDQGGSYGQNVEGLLVASRAWAPGIAHDDFYRTNVGIYVPFQPAPGEPIRFVVRVFDDDGEQVGSGNVTFRDAGVQQFSVGTLGVGRLLDGYVEFECLTPNETFFAYASRVDQRTGDAVYRQAKGFQSDVTP